jgi:hypothetical protein
MVENVLPVLVIPEMVCEKTDEVSAWCCPPPLLPLPPPPSPAAAAAVGVGSGGGAEVVVVGVGAEEADLRRPEKVDEGPDEEEEEAA